MAYFDEIDQDNDVFL